MLPRTSPTKATSGVAIVSASHLSTRAGERPTAGSDEGSISTVFAGKYQCQLPMAIRGSSRSFGVTDGVAAAEN